MFETTNCRARARKGLCRLLLMRGIAGFTLMELMVAVGLALALALVSILALSPRRCTAELKTTATRIVSVLREAGSRATAQEASVDWSVHFSNVATSSPFFALLQGRNYVSPTSSVGYYALPSSVRYVVSTLNEGASTTAAFTQRTGFPSSTLTIGVETYNCERYASSTITLGRTGTVSHE